MTDPEKRQVLQMLDSGKINADQALTLIHALGEEEVDDGNAPMGATESVPAGFTGEANGVVDIAPDLDHQQAEPSTPILDPELESQMKKARSLWGIATGIGVVLTVAGAIGLYSAVLSNGVGFWFFLASLPFFIGVFIIALAITNRGKRWLYVDVQPNKANSPKRIVISVPLSLITWAIAFFGNITSNIGKGALQPILDALEDPAQRENPLLVHIDGSNGEKVTVFIA
jgi:hypothetical protein